MRHITWKQLAQWINEMPECDQIEPVMMCKYGHPNEKLWGLDFIKPDFSCDAYIDYETDNEYDKFLCEGT